VTDHDAKVAEIEAAVSAYFTHPSTHDVLFARTGVKAYLFEVAAKMSRLDTARTFIAREANLADIQIEFPKEVTADTWPGIPWPDRRELLVAAVLDPGMPF
jgi:hypothetical protein